ncbi:hypothetical protein DL96DRAFT_103657 [Flagelloscypha sp. PMI_526]|nr:hypothetical protein DL96DRAFT_103657 [Flagelloscypha sp. PMI_526]
MPDQTLPSETIDTSDPPVLEDTGGTKDETGPSGKAPRKSLPRRSKKRTTYKEPSDDDFEEDERVPAASKKARLDRDRDQAAPNHSQPTAYLANTGPRDPHADAYGRGPLPRMHLPDERNLDPRLPGHAHSQMAPMPAYGAYGSPYDRRPSSFPPEHPYMNGTPPVDAHSPYMFDRPPAHSSPYDHPVGGHHPGHPVPGYFQPPPAQYHPPPAPYYTPPPPQSSYPSPQDSYMYHNYGPSSYAPDGRGPQFLGSHRAASSPRPIDATPGTGMMHPGPPLEDPEVLGQRSMDKRREC